MKTKIIKSTLIVAILGISLWSCKKEVKPTTINNNTEIEYLKIAGKEHNKGLEFVLNEIKEKKKTNAFSFENSEVLLNSIEKYTNNFLTKDSDIINNSTSTVAINFSSTSFEKIKIISLRILQQMITLNYGMLLLKNH